MKIRLLILLISLASRCAQAEDAPIVTDLPFDSPYALKIPNSEITHPDQGAPVWTLSRTITAVSDDTLTLFRIQNPKLTSSRCALSGEVAYQNLPEQSEIQVVASYLGARSLMWATNDAGGLQHYLSRTSDFRPFLLTFSAIQGDNTPLVQLEINVVIRGFSGLQTPYQQTLSFRNLKLIQYPNPPAPPAPTPAPPSPPIAASPVVITQPIGLHWPSFWIGASASAVLLLAFAQLLLLIQRWKRARHDREMRRMASLDS